jgi:hypothetical protein
MFSPATILGPDHNADPDDHPYANSALRMTRRAAGRSSRRIMKRVLLNPLRHG